MPPLRVDKTLWPAAALLAAAFLLFEFTGLDLFLQDRLHDFATHGWLIDRHDSILRLAFYDLPKVFIIVLGVALLGLAVGPARWRDRWPLTAPSRRHLFVAFLTIGTVPALIGQLKATTNIFCPSEIRRYGGNVPYVRVMERYPADDRPTKRGRCFPAGHASGGFALLALCGLGRNRRAQMLGVALGLGFGGAMGFYQMAKGAHYLSHTVITALIAWIGFLFWRRALRVAQIQTQTDETLIS